MGGCDLLVDPALGEVFDGDAARGNTDRVVVRQVPHGPVPPFFS